MSNLFATLEKMEINAGKDPYSHHLFETLEKMQGYQPPTGINTYLSTEFEPQTPLATPEKVKANSYHTPFTRPVKAQMEKANDDFDLAKFMLGTAQKGIDSGAKTISNTLAFVEDKAINPVLEFLFPGVTQDQVYNAADGTTYTISKGPFKQLNESINRAVEETSAKYDANTKAGGKVAEVVETLGAGAIAAIPQLVAAYGSGGTSVGLSAASTAAQTSPTLLNTIKAVASNTVKNPQYWVSFFGTVGNDYESAKQTGASDLKASFYALGTSLMNAAVEVGGGIQSLPAELQGGESAFRAWVDAMLDEGKEGAVQGVISRGMETIMGVQDNPLVSLTDERAVLNPKTIAQDAALEAAVSGILSAAPTIVNASARKGAQGGSATVPPVSEGNNAPEIKTPQNGFKSDSTGKNYLKAYDAVETAAIQHVGKTFKNIVAGVDTSISDFFNKWKGGRKSHQGEILEKLYIGKVTDAARAQLSDLLGYDVKSTDYIITADNVKHIMDQHGNDAKEIQRGNLPLSSISMDDLADIVANPDRIVLGDSENWEAGRQGVQFEKNIGNGTVVYVQFDNFKRGTIEPRTLYIKKEVPTSAVNTANAASTYTSKTTEPETSKSMIAQPQVDVNTNDGLGAADAGSVNTGYDNLQAQSSSFYPEGSNPARIPDVPKFDFDGNHISQSASTVIGSQAIPESMVPTAEQLVADGLLSYDVVTDASAMQSAENTILDIGWDGAMEKLRQATKHGYTSKEMNVLAQRMLVNAANAQNAKQFAELLVMYQTMRTNVGQAMQAGTLLRKMSPEWQLYGVQRSVANLKAELESKYKKNVPDVQINEALIGKFLSQQDQAGRDSVMEEIYRDVAQQVPSTWMDKWNAWRYLSMLSAPKTHIRNVAGNIGFQPARIIKNEIAAAVESALSAFGADIERTKSFTVSPAMYKAAWNDFDSVSDIVGGNRYESTTGKIMQERDIFKFQPLESARRGNSKALEWEDAIFKRITYADSLAQYLKANGITAAQMESSAVDAGLLSKARSYAAQEALKATYQDSNAISNRTGKIVESMGTFGDAVMPFKRTPANILARAFEYSPLGLAKSLSADLVRVKRGDISASQAIDNIASGLTGTGLFSLGMYLFAKGVISPGMGDDEEDKWSELLGHQGYALELGDGTSVTLDWLAPESLPFFMGVEAMSAIGENGFQLEDISDALASIAEPMLEMSMLQSVNDLIDSVTYADSSQKVTALLGSALISYFSQAIPTLGGQLERAFEEQRMTSYTDKNSALPTDIQYALSKASSKIPGWDYQQIPYIDAWGRTESAGDPLERAANNLFNPAYMSEVNVDNVESELQRLYDATGKNVFPKRAGKYFTVNGKRKDLTADEYVRYARAKGVNGYKFVQQAQNTSAYKNMSNDQEAKFVSEMYEYANYKAKKAVAPNYQNDTYKKYEEAEKAGISPAEYYAIKQSADTNGKN